MKTRRFSPSQQPLAELTRHAPYVATQRMLRMAQAGAAPTAADRREWSRMTQEKWSAAQEGAVAMTAALFEMQQKAWLETWRAAWTPWTLASSMQWWARNMRAADGVVAAGLRPAARRVSANARRLSR